MGSRGPVLRGRVEVFIEKVVPGGDGLARLEGTAVFVPGTVPGDRVEAEIELVRTGYARARLVSVIDPGPSRRPNSEVCPHAARVECGGCDLPHVAPDGFRGLKTGLLLDALARIGKLSPASLPEPGWIGSPFGYRLRARLHWDGESLGLYAPRSRRVATIQTCEILGPALVARLPALRAALAGALAPTGELVTLEGREGSPLVVELRSVEPVESRLAASVVDALLGAGCAGARVVTDRDGGEVEAEGGASGVDIPVAGTALRVSVSSFFQGNRFLLDDLVSEVDRLAGPEPVDSAADLYAGAGLLTWPLVRRAGSVTAVESSRSSARDLRTNVDRWIEGGGTSVTVVEETVERWLAAAARGRRSGRHGWDLLVADPPRAGLSPSARKGIAGLGPRRLVLVSCDPSTLARDLRELLAGGYRLEALTLLDLFPGTHHVEALCRLTR